MQRRKVLRIEGEALAGYVERLVVAACAPDDARQVRVAVRIRRGEGHGLATLHLCLPDQSGSLQGAGTSGVGESQLRIEVNRLVGGRKRLVPSALVRQGHGQEGVGDRGLGKGLDYPTKGVLGRLGLVARQQVGALI